MRTGRQVLCACALLAAAACAGADKTNPIPAGASAPKPAYQPMAAARDQGVKSAAARPTQSASSLDALRRGESATTAPGSPLQEIYFEFDSYDLSAQARAILKASAEWLKNNPSLRAEIEGHCDERGTTEYNLALGAKRAQAAKDFLVSLGISAARLTTTSYGEEVPACREPSEGCWQKNRRDRFVAVGKPGA